MKYSFWFLSSRFTIFNLRIFQYMKVGKTACILNVCTAGSFFNGRGQIIISELSVFDLSITESRKKIFNRFVFFFFLYVAIYWKLLFNGHLRERYISHNIIGRFHFIYIVKVCIYCKKLSN